MIYGYARISTVKQLSGNSLEEQESILRGEGCQEVIVEQYTGKTTERPKLQELILLMKANDTLIVTKLDRFARTVHEGSKLIQNLIDRDITVIIKNIGTISSKPMDRLMLNVLLSFAEFERSMIIERTQGGKEIAKTKAGFKDGRPAKYTSCQLDHAMKLLSEGNSYTQVERMTTISKSTLIRRKRKEQIIIKGFLK